MSFEPTYKQEPGPDLVSFDAYAVRTQAQFMQLISSDAKESEVQTFLERNPALVPGAWTPGSISGHAPMHCALISQPRLPGLRSRQPDFMWIACHSLTWFPTLIEIERPSKRLFNKNGEPTQEFSQARNQLAQWRAWFNSPANVTKFIEDYGIDAEYQRSMNMQLHMILVYGRRSEFEANPQLSRQRSNLFPGADEELMSFDRLTVDEDLQDAVTVRAAGSGRYQVIKVMPTFSTSPFVAEHCRRLDGFHEGIDNTEGISAERKLFLKRRIDYWREWASNRSVIGHYYRE